MEEEKLYQLSKDKVQVTSNSPGTLFSYNPSAQGALNTKKKNFCHSLEDGGVEAEKMGGRGGKGNGEGENKLKTVRVRGGAYCRRGEGKKAHTVRKERKKGEKRLTINEGTT